MNSEWIIYFRFYVCTSERHFNAFYEKTEREKDFKDFWNETEERIYDIIFLGFLHSLVVNEILCWIFFFAEQDK